MSKKKIFVLIGIAVVIIASVIVLIIVLNHQPPKDEVTPPSSGDSAVKSLDQILDIPKTIIPNEETPPTLTLIEERNGYELLSFKESADTAVGIFKVYSPDIYSVAKQIDSTMTNSTKEQLEAEILKELANAQIIEKEVSIEFIIVNGKYKPQLTAEFLDAYYGGVYKLREEFLAEQNKEGK